MKATHIDYLHPQHLRVEDGQRHAAWNSVDGNFVRTAICVSPSSSQYDKLKRPGLPKWKGDRIIDGIAVPIA